MPQPLSSHPLQKRGMDNPVRPIAVVQGAPGPVIQQIFHSLAECWTPHARVVGALEYRDADHRSTRNMSYLRCIGDPARYPLFQQLGPGATGCSLDPSGVVLAGEVVRRQIAAGCDLVLLSKFGKMEAEERSGLLCAFIAAVERGIPVLTSVAPRYADCWAGFASPLFQHLAPDELSIELWWQNVRNPDTAPALSAGLAGPCGGL